MKKTEGEKSKINNNSEIIEKSEAIIMVEIIEYEPHSVVSKTIINKTTGNVSVMSFDNGEGLGEKIIPFDTFAQIIDGKAEIIIDGESHSLNTGQSIIIPAHTSNKINANERFKMIQTVIKSGYE
ncbi:MAG: cupin domain-containing protein [FCB group bacterium]